ncbi:TOMM precursor leader peptide-binding protein [Alicyclobacillus cycloheptanicus]|uniref:Ribosomal protein S12 methylthiotransferase accessory factor n=1 Tax=Alicyclobacillus cycloheptanicus TaxID=1457 RepID=A0ABT9XJQ6_9BACL|nr:TOMM precursor leader peptide-binding protein [Alicyclobacillus cycloheptanicus]MDQ0190355.1 ribosomal protein S12 methylthiotransferase accessory factor [Alicyclobacillus cycloheptanicus]WDM00008.1 TOMM precursor leader peptide-binding protein [Alicyclobacillus cycloheptanicus]
MNSRVLVLGGGMFADTVCQWLQRDGICDCTRLPAVPTERLPAADLAVVLDDGWHPAIHAAAEAVFRKARLPWLRGYIAFGHGYIGPLVQPGQPGCSHCADGRMLMAEADRREMMQLRMQLAAEQTARPDAWATRTGIRHLAALVVAEVRRILHAVETCRVVNHTLCVRLKTLDTTRHFILPDAACPVCGTLPEDTEETARIALSQTWKASADRFRSRSIEDLSQQLAHDYLDARTGLLNGKVYDLVTPFAAVSVNLPLLIGDEGASGRAHSYDVCEPIAILEGLERYCGYEPRGKRPVVYDSYAHLCDRALNPVTVGLHDPRQYKRPDFPYRAFDKDAAMDWVWGYSLTQQRPLLVPKRLAYYSLGCQGGFVYETSNGCAIGGSLVEAVFHGTLELVERDAFLMTWYARLPLPAIDVSACKDVTLQWMIERVRTVTGYDLHFYNATMENGIPTVFVIARNARPHGLHLLCSAGAHVDALSAIKGAIHETAGMLLRFDEKLEAERATYLRMLEDSSLVRHMDDHSMLYGLPEAAGRLRFLLDDNRPVQSVAEFSRTWPRHMDLTDDLMDLLQVFNRLNLEVIVVNQTSPELARNNLHCVKVIIPGMLPMTFGHHLTRLEHLPRVLTVPMKLGYVQRPLRRKDLNPNPHPFP